MILLLVLASAIAGLMVGALVAARVLHALATFDAPVERDR